MTARIFSGDARIEALPAQSRAFTYGDGLFETMHVRGGRIAWWEQHWTRLASGAARLEMAIPEQRLVQAEASDLFDDHSDGVLKLVVSRGGDARGYAPVDGAPPLWVISRHGLPPPLARGLRLHWCRTQASVQPALAGLKHCNRLEQVLARNECRQQATDEGLMCDPEGMAVGATSANVFARIDGRWCTPLVDRAGVAGVCRSHLLGLLHASETRLSRDAVEDAEAVFLCNAVRGILPVERIGLRTWCNHDATLECRHLLARIHPGMTPDLEHS